MPTLGIIPSVALPWGRSEHSSGASDPMVKLTWAKNVPLGFAHSGYLNWASLTDEAGRMTQNAATLSVGHDLGSGFRGYWEVYRFSREERDGKPVGIFQTGITHGVGSSAQLDFSVSRRLTVQGPGWAVSTGLVIRNSLGFSRLR